MYEEMISWQERRRNELLDVVEATCSPSLFWEIATDDLYLVPVSSRLQGHLRLEHFIKGEFVNIPEEEDYRFKANWEDRRFDEEWERIEATCSNKGWEYTVYMGQHERVMSNRLARFINKKMFN